MPSLHDKLMGSGTSSIAPAEKVKQAIRKGAFILDVRTKLEARRGIAPGATNISLLVLKRHLDELPRDRTLLTYCGTGARAGKAKDILEAAGFKVVNAGGYAGIVKLIKSL